MRLKNCRDYGHNLGQFNPSTQINNEYSVESSCKQCLSNLSLTLMRPSTAIIVFFVAMSGSQVLYMQYFFANLLENVVLL